MRTKEKYRSVSIHVSERTDRALAILKEIRGESASAIIGELVRRASARAVRLAKKENDMRA